MVLELISKRDMMFYSSLGDTKLLMMMLISRMQTAMIRRTVMVTIDALRPWKVSSISVYLAAAKKTYKYQLSLFM